MTPQPKYAAVIFKRKKCADCDTAAKEGHEPGLYERIDCGCVFGYEVGRYDTLATARLVAAGQAAKNGTRHGGRNTGHWNVETEEDGVIAAN